MEVTETVRDRLRRGANRYGRQPGVHLRADGSRARSLRRALPRVCGALIREWREHTGLSLTEAADLFGVSVTKFRGWQSDRRAPSRDDHEVLVRTIFG